MWKILNFIYLGQFSEFDDNSTLAIPKVVFN